MTFEEANEKAISTIREEKAEAEEAFGCTYNTNICISCTNKDECNRDNPSIKTCNFYDDYAEQLKVEKKGEIYG